MSDIFTHRLIRASAGSGKTHQLTNCYLRLLSAGVEPNAILATTFTRKAAGEILDRVLLRLAKAADDATAAQELAAQIGRVDATQAVFTTLLRSVLRNLHRLRIGTLDSFYVALGGNFSLELGIPAGWTICEERDDELQRRDSLERILEQQPADVARLLPLLSKGDTTRSVHGELQEIASKHYEIYLGSERSAWERLRVTPPVPEAEINAAVRALRQLDLSRHGKRLVDARDKDLANFETANWQEFVARGLAGKIAADEPTYYNKPIPPQALPPYQTLVRHAKSAILHKLFEQTKATWEWLDRFHRDLWMHKQSSGQLRFADVTQALATEVKRNTFSPEQLAFRLDGAIEHLLLDEFQDTALGQWHVVSPMARASAIDKHRAFFCVGDVKQAIFRWRGGNAEILEALPAWLGNIQEEVLVESRRSAQPVIDVVNRLFGSLRKLDGGDKNRDGLDAWAKRFVVHTTHRKGLLGYVRLHAGPAADDKAAVDQRGEHLKYAATKIRDLAAKAQNRSIGVLCRKNETVARLIFELRRAGVIASEEGGNPLTDSPAVELVLSLFSLADHPGHTVAWFHLQNSPLREYLVSFADAEAFSRHLRGETMTQGYGQFTQIWAKRVAPSCNERDLARLQQLVEEAYAYQPRSTLRSDDFVAWVRGKSVPDPSGANVRVMTIHASKGLEFDAVVLPELDTGLAGQTPSFVVGRDPKSLDVNFVCRYASEAEQKLLDAGDRRVFELDRQQRVEESLSLLYVAMTRAIYALYLIIPGPRDGKFAGKTGWHSLLIQALAPDVTPRECAALFEHGNADWLQKMEPAAAAPPEKSSAPRAITFRGMDAERRRGLERIAPSSREGMGQVSLARLFHPSEGTGKSAGTLYHAWFESIAWLDDGAPTDEELRAIAMRLRTDLPAETWRDLDQLLANFRKWLHCPAIDAVLRRSAYANPERPGFPSALASTWNESLKPQKVERERRFLVRHGESLLNGSLDRIVWLGDGKQLVAADVIDFKTDKIATGDEVAVAAQTEHYRPQMDAYRQAVARFAGLPPECVSLRLLFATAERVVEV